MEKQWPELTKEEKRDKRMEKYLSGEGINFRDAKAEKYYKERVNRIVKAARCEVPDRVPVAMPTGLYPVMYGGHRLKECMEDAGILRYCWLKFMDDFYEDMDSFNGAGTVFNSEAMAMLECQNYSWPGHGLAEDVNSLQYKEKIFMNSDEYDQLLKDPSNFSFKVLTPRVVGAAAALEYFPPLSSLLSSPMAFAGPFTRPEVRESFKKLIAAGEKTEVWQREQKAIANTVTEAGFPDVIRGLGIAPFDVIGNFLRGTEGTSIDMFRKPEQLLEAIDLITELFIPRTIESVTASGAFNVGFPLHRGDDTFMSRKQFEKFYWPSLKKILDALIEEGIQVALFAEGAYNHRLDYIGDFPKGWVSWQFDQTDMKAAKQAIGDRCCISGNVPASVVITGTPEQVKDNCRRLIEDCAPGGGYVLTGGCPADETKNPANLRAFMEAALEYGVY